MKDSLRAKLLDYIIAYQRLARTELTKLAREWGYEKSNCERRMRELCEDYPIKRYDAEGKEVKHSHWICYWKLTGKIKPKTIFK